MLQKKLDPDLSQRIALLRFPLILGILFLHANTTTVSMADGAVGIAHTGMAATLVRSYISGVLARVSVPLFYLLSGFLFYYGFVFSKNAYLSKLKSRVRSLLVPFLFWNLLVLALYAVAQAIPYTAPFFSGNREPVASFGMFDYLNAVFGFTQMPIAYQFWFIRDLMAIVLLVPVFEVLLKRAPYGFLVLSGAAWFFEEFWPLYIPTSDAVFFFYAGALLAVKGFDARVLDRWGVYAAAAYLALSAADALYGNVFVHKAGILFGIAAAVYVTKLVPENGRLRALLLSLAPASFFVFAAHDPLMTVIRKLAFRLFPPYGDPGVIALYLAVPCAATILCVALYSFLIRALPVPTRIITGGR
jgi:surface polysaccharide O-acyltransferase-like enzyme